MTEAPFPRKQLLAVNALVALGVALTLPASLADGGGGPASEMLRTIGRWTLLASGVSFGAWRVFDIARRRPRHSLRGWGVAPTLAAAGAAIYLAVAIPVFALRSGGESRRDEARAAGERAERAVLAFHRRAGRYPADWGELADAEPNLRDIGDVTFVFSRADDSGYAFHTRVAGASGSHYFSSRNRALEDLAADRYERRLDTGDPSP
jgi:hypothetical protein